MSYYAASIVNEFIRGFTFEDFTFEAGIIALVIWLPELK